MEKTKEISVPKKDDLKHYLRGTPAAYKYQAERFFKFLQENDFKLSDVQGWHAFTKALKGVVKPGHPGFSKRMEGQHLSAAIQQKYIQAMVNRIQYAADHSDMSVAEKYILITQIKQIKRPKRALPRPKFLKAGQVWKLINTLREDNGEYSKTFSELSLMIEFLFASALRISQMLDLTVKDFHPDNAHFVAQTVGKGGVPHLIEIEKELYDRILKGFKPEGNRIYLFSKKDGDPFRREAISLRIKRAGKRILGESISAHVLRHSIATYFYEKTHDIHAVQQLLGHADISTTSAMYVHSVLTREVKDSVLAESKKELEDE